MGSAIDQILCMQDTIFSVRHREYFNSTRPPLYNPKEADGSKRQILSAIGSAPIYVSELSHGTCPSDSTLNPQLAIFDRICRQPVHDSRFTRIPA